VNFFAHESAAGRYVNGRRYFHPAIIRRIKERLSLTGPFERALDVGCRTGLSTIALKEIASRVTGVDSSAARIALAPEKPGTE
jgi:predicted TPR repeat methyltransferase